MIFNGHFFTYGQHQFVKAFGGSFLKSRGNVAICVKCYLYRAMA